MELLVVYIEEKGVPHNFAEFLKIKACFLYNFQEKVRNLKISRGHFGKVLIKTLWSLFMVGVALPQG